MARALEVRSPRFFRTPAEFRRWLAAHHATAADLWVGFHRRATGRPSITWPESVDEALCVGWIDGMRKSLDAERYAIRFSPRKPTSIWSAVNTRRAKELIAAGRMRPAGLKAFEARRANRSGVYSFEQRSTALPPKYAAKLRANAAASAYFAAKPPWYRRTAVWWVVSAKREETRLRRLAQLIEESARGRHIKPLRLAEKREE